MGKNVCVIGLGYVGLPLALLAARKGYNVTGIDINEQAVQSLKKGETHLEDDAIQGQLKDTTAAFTTSFEPVKEADIVIICVPTPVDNRKLPDLTPVKKAVSSCAEHLKKHALLIVESTINPGVCDEIVLPLVEKGSGMNVGTDIYLAHCPERINPGDTKWNVENINRVVGASSKTGLKLAKEFYESIITGEVKAMGSLKEAEAVKIIENSFRDINIAFINELAQSFHKLGVNLENVIDGAATKPFAFMPHRPGCGVGGHCIPVDPYYLIEHARGYGFEHKFLKMARDINESMPAFTVELLEEEIKARGLDKKVPVILLGLAYKSNVGDLRESPALSILEILKNKGYDVKTFDPFTKSDFGTLEEALAFGEAAVIATGHDVFKNLSAENYKSNNVKIVIDGRNVYKEKKEEFVAQKISYKGIGI